MLIETYIMTALVSGAYTLYDYFHSSKNEKRSKDKKGEQKELKALGLNDAQYIEWKNLILEYVKNKDESNLSSVEKLFSDFEANPTLEMYSKIMRMLTSYLSENQDSPKSVPTVFISYSWDDEEHKQWVLDLAALLATKGINVILDRWEIRPGRLLPNFMELAVRSSDRVICVMTPNYRKKTDNLEGGVGVEYSIISAEIQRDVKTEKFIPLFRKGTKEDVPTFLKGRAYVDMREGTNFDESIDELVRAIWNEPKFKKPKIGPKPKFD